MRWGRDDYGGGEGRINSIYHKITETMENEMGDHEMGDHGWQYVFENFSGSFSGRMYTNNDSLLVSAPLILCPARRRRAGRDWTRPGRMSSGGRRPMGRKAGRQRTST